MINRRTIIVSLGRLGAILPVAPVLLTQRTVPAPTAVGRATPTETERSAWLALGRSSITARFETE